ncbi:zinc transport system substrate-binding protein [Anaerotaenia torta]|uniref:metal ABC transporter solute-binding protein, Zn/Mn family n=1 Tax=Anaerotaenia torta TaxID=433293 RepID=UPI003D1F83DA
MKKSISIMLMLILIITVMSGCAKSGNPSDSADKISVVSTIFAPYDFVREIVGDKAEITMLLPPGSESHSYEPTPQDIIKIQNCDVFVYVGGDSDAWVHEVLESMDTSKMKIITLMDCVEAVEEELVEGMEDDHGHDHGSEDFDPANVKDRPMSDFNGGWISGIPLINDGSLDEYIEHTAEENQLTWEERKAALLTQWASDYDNLTIDNNTLTIGTLSGEYAYKGYQITESDHGASVWYNFEIVTPVEGLPSYLSFHDHEYGYEEEHHDEDEHEEEHEEIGHIHLKYGNEGFDALISKEDWAAFYFDSSHSGKEIGEFMAGHEHEDAELDEHVWTSPRNAKLIVQKISDALCEADSTNAELYKENTASYLTQLDELDAAFREVAASASHKTLIFGDRFPFRYLVDAYGLEYFAAFPGCSTETEASAATVAFLIDKTKAESIPVVFHIELSNQKMADTISEATGAKVLLLHSCHNVTKAEIESGVSYLDLMKQNVENLKEALR